MFPEDLECPPESPPNNTPFPLKNSRSCPSGNIVVMLQCGIHYTKEDALRMFWQCTISSWEGSLNTPRMSRGFPESLPNNVTLSLKELHIMTVRKCAGNIRRWHPWERTVSSWVSSYDTVWLKPLQEAHMSRKTATPEQEGRDETPEYFLNKCAIVLN